MPAAGSGDHAPPTHQHTNIWLWFAGECVALLAAIYVSYPLVRMRRKKTRGKKNKWTWGW